MLTKAEVFQKVKSHLLEQGCKSSNPKNDMCLYRGPSGRKCAAGVLIDDEHYSEALETSRSDTPVVIAALIASGVPRAAISMVRELQAVHDEMSVSRWPVGLEEVAANHLGI